MPMISATSTSEPSSTQCRCELIACDWTRLPTMKPVTYAGAPGTPTACAYRFASSRCCGVETLDGKAR
jgi:hypothetical protein